MNIKYASVILANIPKLSVKYWSRANAHTLIIHALNISELKNVSLGFNGYKVNQKNLSPNLMFPLRVHHRRYIAIAAKTAVERNSTCPDLSPSKKLFKNG